MPPGRRVRPSRRTPPREVANAPPTSAPTTAAPAAAKPEVRAPTLEDEARRLFGSNRRTPSGRPERAYGGAEIPWHAGNGQCEQVPEHPDSVVVMGFVAGQVIGSDNGKPLPGAYLQILGTPYSTYSDNGGFYKLSFDLALVANCRTQAVRVTAPGYSAADLLLGVGVGNNTVPLRRLARLAPRPASQPAAPATDFRRTPHRGPSMGTFVKRTDIPLEGARTLPRVVLHRSRDPGAGNREDLRAELALCRA